MPETGALYVWVEVEPDGREGTIAIVTGDAAQFLKRWAGGWDNYEAWVDLIKATTTVCCVDSANEIVDVWWFGFDCAHAGDMSPGLAAITRAIPMPEYLYDPDVYRDFAYVEAECLANQLADMHVAALSNG
jgi:hypothetical protein